MKKCPVHGIPYKVGKNYLSQPYLYCKKCKAEKRRMKELEERIEKLESKQ
jgi:hypothetical protein